MYRNKDRDEQISLTCDIVASHTGSIAWVERKIVDLQLEVAKLQNEAADTQKRVCKLAALRKADLEYGDALVKYLKVDAVEIEKHIEFISKEKEESKSDEA